MTELDRIIRLLEQSGDPDNPSPELLADIYARVKRIAVVGMSRDSSKPARRIPSYLAANGYELLPVNPHADRILGQPSHAHLDEISSPVDMVLVFRPPDEAGEVIRSAANRPECPVIWLQEGIRADAAAQAARASGCIVVQDLCFYTLHRILDESLAEPSGPERR